MRNATFALLLFVCACGGAEEQAEACSWLGAELGEAGDTVVSLSPASYVSLSNGGSNPARVRLREGQLAFSPLGCTPGPDQTCSYELSALRVVLNGFSIGDLRVSDYGLFVRGPAELQDQGSGLSLSSGGKASACARFDDELTGAREVRLEGFGVGLDEGAQALELTLSYDATFELKEGPPVVREFTGGARVELFGDLAAAGEQPWTSR